MLVPYYANLVSHSCSAFPSASPYLHHTYAVDSACVRDSRQRQCILQDVRYQLHDEAEDHRLYKLAQKQLKQIEKRQLKGQAVLPLLENSVINLACDDPGAAIGPQLILPTLRKRLLDRAHEFHQAEAIRERVQVATVTSAAATVTVCMALKHCSCM